MEQAHLTQDMIEKINRAVDYVITSSRFGEVIIVIEKGAPRWIRTSHSEPLPAPPQATDKPQ